MVEAKGICYSFVREIEGIWNFFLKNLEDVYHCIHYSTALYCMELQNSHSFLDSLKTFYLLVFAHNT